MQILLLIKRALILVSLFTLIPKYDAVNWNCSTPETSGTFDVNDDCTLTIEVATTGDLSLEGTNQTTLKIITAAQDKRHFKVYNGNTGSAYSLTLKHLKLKPTGILIIQLDTSGGTSVGDPVQGPFGGSIFMLTDTGALTIVNCIFDNHRAGNGGAIFYYSYHNASTGSVTISDSYFHDNKVALVDISHPPDHVGERYASVIPISFKALEFGMGGAIYIGSAVANSVQITNTIFDDNEAWAAGGAVYVQQMDKTAAKKVVFTNTVFLTNTQKTEVLPGEDTGDEFTHGGGAVVFFADSTATDATLEFISCKFVDNVATSLRGHNVLLHNFRPKGTDLNTWHPSQFHIVMTNTVMADSTVRRMLEGTGDLFSLVGCDYTSIPDDTGNDLYYTSAINMQGAPVSGEMYYQSVTQATCTNFPAVSPGTIAISTATTAGVYTTSGSITTQTPCTNAGGTWANGYCSGYLYPFAKGDQVNISSCSISTGNNGNFVIGSVANGNSLTLVDKNTKAAILTATDTTDCTISRAQNALATCHFDTNRICCEKRPQITKLNTATTATDTALGGTEIGITGINFDSPTNQIANNVITINTISTDGIYTLDDLSTLAVDDLVTIAGCTHFSIVDAITKESRDSHQNNGAFRISNIDANTKAVTLVNMNSYASIVTHTNKIGCTIERSNFVITTNGNVWDNVTRNSDTSITATVPPGVGGNLPVKIVVNGVISKYDVASFSYALPNITLIHTIPKLNGGSSSRLHVIADEIGDLTTLHEISIIIAAEGASACGGTACTNLNLVAVTAIADDVITIVGVTTAGVYTLDLDVGSSLLATGDIVTISGCADSGSLINNGKFKISLIATSDGDYKITLVNKDTGESITTGTEDGDCKISREPYNIIDCLYTTAGAKSACMDVVLSAGNQKSPPRTFCYGSEDAGAIIITENVPDVTEGTSTPPYKLKLNDVARTESVVIEITVTNTVPTLP
eukprot:g8811.t1